MPKMALSTVSVSVPELLAGFTRNDGSLHDVLEGLLLEGVNDCLNKRKWRCLANDKLCNTDNAGNNAPTGRALRRRVHRLETAALSAQSDGLRQCLDVVRLPSALSMPLLTRLEDPASHTSNRQYLLWAAQNQLELLVGSRCLAECAICCACAVVQLHSRAMVAVPTPSAPPCGDSSLQTLDPLWISMRFYRCCNVRLALGLREVAPR